MVTDLVLYLELSIPNIMLQYVCRTKRGRLAQALGAQRLYNSLSDGSKQVAMEGSERITGLREMGVPGMKEELDPENMLLRSDSPRVDSWGRGWMGDSEPKVDAGESFPEGWSKSLNVEKGT
ncbi:hypothetical protein PM082_005523 [Marasmius tenuissimus]|nr:hypothetical protein PM082_005523 [Marasmius tenuissimus]